VVENLSQTLPVPFRRFPPLVAGATMGAGHFRQPVLMAAAAEKPYNRASSVEMHPFWCWRTTFLLKGSMSLDSQVAALPYESSSFATPRGGLLAALCNEQLKLAQGESIEQTSPSGGSTAAGGDRGAFPSGRRPGRPVFPARQGGFKVLSKLAPQVPTTTL